MSHMQLLAKGAGQGTPPSWIIAIGVIVIVGVAFLVTRARRR
jgi:LPXTG-motif cell wall-anchored protein